MEPADDLIAELVKLVSRDPQDAWETALARGLLPSAWAEDPKYGFECMVCTARETFPKLAECAVCRNERIVPYPQYAALFEAVLRNVAAFQRAELLAFEVPYAVNRLYAECGPATTVPTIESVTWAYNPFLGLKVPAELRTDTNPRLYARQWREGGHGGWILEHIRAEGMVSYNRPFARSWANETEIAPLVEIARLGARFGFWARKNSVGGEIALTPRQKAGAVLMWGGPDT